MALRDALQRSVLAVDEVGRFSVFDSREASLYAKANDPADMARKIVDLLSDSERRQARGWRSFEP